MQQENKTPQRKSIRLKQFNYSESGEYFITICILNKRCLFGRIENHQMLLNELGEMVKKWWLKLPEKFPHIGLDEFIIMPNHLHGIISVGADPRVRPPQIPNSNLNSEPTNYSQILSLNFNTEPLAGGHAGPPLRIPNSQLNIKPYTGGHVGKIAIPAMIQWFKTMTTNEYFKSQNATTKLWQRNYYEHIIRNEKSFNQICDYIIANPTNWESDKLYVKQLQKINELKFTQIP